ncbi:BTAD domain-containing putative transcriptional regulator [Streptomyces cadmiisoli]|uniref:BTAD domain-containing putative transcriptional regulator n=1 Tax=Streptomyces cadmiisoli TaxID=2184053 RepID=UPI0036619638
MTARKILQNAIWGLRRALLPTGAATAPVALRTQPPGYCLDVPLDRIDLHLFHRWVKDGRSRLEAGEPDTAVQLLSDALDLWRGPALLDITEAGLMWPELSSLESTRLDVLEDFFEAHLACGRHQTVLGQLESVVEAEPLRERACGQLMRALYRCGRQSDALGVFSRLRTLLVEDLGLEPSRELQQLQQAILNHDPDLALVQGGALSGPRGVASLAAAEPPAPAGLTAAATEPQPHVPENIREGRFPKPPQFSVQGSGPGPKTSAAAPLRAVLSAPVLDTAPKVLTALAAPASEPLTFSTETGPSTATVRQATARALPTAVPAAGSTVSSAVRRQASIIAVRAEPDPVPGDCAELDAWTDHMSHLVQREVENQGGVVISSLCDFTVALFVAEPDDTGCSVRAVQAAEALRGVLAAPFETPDGAPAAVQVRLRVSVASGEVLVSQSLSGSAPPKVFGARVMSESGALLDLASSSHAHVCDRTRQETREHFSYEEIPGTPTRWKLLGEIEPPREEGTDQDDSHHRELDLLQGAMTHSSRWSQPHLITVLGTADARRGRMLDELQLFATEVLDRAQVLTWSCEEAGESGSFDLHRTIISGYCGVLESDPPWAVRQKISTVVDRLDAAKSCSNWLVARCTSLFESVNRPSEWLGAQEWMDVWRYFLEAAAQDGPLVLIIDNLHRADKAARELVGLLARLPDMIPLTVIVGADPELVRHPDWSNDRGLATIVMLDKPTEEELACSTA